MNNLMNIAKIVAGKIINIEYIFYERNENGNTETDREVFLGSQNNLHTDWSQISTVQNVESADVA